jgi:hypothetical protein
VVVQPAEQNTSIQRARKRRKPSDEFSQKLEQFQKLLLSTLEQRSYVTTREFNKIQAAALGTTLKNRPVLWKNTHKMECNVHAVANFSAGVPSRLEVRDTVYNFCGTAHVLVRLLAFYTCVLQGNDGLSDGDEAGGEKEARHAEQGAECGPASDPNLQPASAAPPPRESGAAGFEFSYTIMDPAGNCEDESVKEHEEQGERVRASSPGQAEAGEAGNQHTSIAPHSIEILHYVGNDVYGENENSNGSDLFKFLNPSSSHVHQGNDGLSDGDGAGGEKEARHAEQGPECGPASDPNLQHASADPPPRESGAAGCEVSYTIALDPPGNCEDEPGKVHEEQGEMVRASSSPGQAEAGEAGNQDTLIVPHSMEILHYVRNDIYGENENSISSDLFKLLNAPSSNDNTFSFTSFKGQDTQTLASESEEEQAGRNKAAIQAGEIETDQGPTIPERGVGVHLAEPEKEMEETEHMPEKGAGVHLAEVGMETDIRKISAAITTRAAPPYGENMDHNKATIQAGGVETDQGPPMMERGSDEQLEEQAGGMETDKELHMPEKGAGVHLAEVGTETDKGECPAVMPTELQAAPPDSKTRCSICFNDSENIRVCPGCKKRVCVVCSSISNGLLNAALPFLNKEPPPTWQTLNCLGCEKVEDYDKALNECLDEVAGAVLSSLLHNNNLDK